MEVKSQYFSPNTWLPLPGDSKFAAERYLNERISPKISQKWLQVFKENVLKYSLDNIKDQILLQAFLLVRLDYTSMLKFI